MTEYIQLLEEVWESLDSPMTLNEAVCKEFCNEENR